MKCQQSDDAINKQSDHLENYLATNDRLFFNFCPFANCHNNLSCIKTLMHIFIYRSSYQRCSVEIGVLRNFVKFTGKHLCQRLFFNKVAIVNFEQVNVGWDVIIPL